MNSATAAMASGRPAFAGGTARGQAGAALIGLIGLISCLAGWSWLGQSQWSRPVPAAGDPAAMVTKAPPVILEPQSFKRLTAQDAVAENAHRPLDKRRIEIAFPFILAPGLSDTTAWERAAHCLTLANYYEAAGEGDAGMRAVSQVVLNRMRHPAFPHSVCGVVFEGASRPTGCQFTFTCDGSLSRPPLAPLLARARAIAIAALNGRVEASVGMATHYHANTVVPYWADELDKVRTVGNHIFYLWRGSWGNRAAFRSIYVGEAADSALPYFAPLREVTGRTEPATAPLASGTGWINLPAQSEAGLRRDRTFLAADEPHGTLKLDEDGNAGTLRTQPLTARPGEKVVNDDR